MNTPLSLCESRDAKGLYKLARAGKIKGVHLKLILDMHLSYIDMSYELSPSLPINLQTPVNEGKNHDKDSVQVV